MSQKNEHSRKIDYLIKEATKEIESKSYSEKYKRAIILTFSRFQDHAAALGVEVYSTELGKNYLTISHAERGIKCSQTEERAINILTDYANFGKVLRRTKQPEDIWKGALSEYFSEYYAYCKLSGLSEGSFENIHRSLKAFMLYLENIGVVEIAAIDTNHLYDLIGTRFSKNTKKDKNRILRDIRRFLEYLHSQGIETKIFNHAFPHVRAFDESEGIPNVFTKDEVSRLLTAVDRGSPLGKRDYAILLLASRYGMRACDIRNLTFENIDWQEEKISFVQTKTGEPLTLPLFKDVGWSIIDYIEKGRPVSSCPYIFLIHNAPYDRFISSMSHIVEKYINMAKIPIRPNTSPGMHAFRHTLASEMLRGGTQISSIKEVLGHATITTTAKYQRIDIRQLACCALEVPYANH